MKPKLNKANKKVYVKGAQGFMRINRKKEKPKVKILRVIKTKGLHSWVETDKGVVRKENKNIPAKFF
jgi:hypothetical protein